MVHLAHIFVSGLARVVVAAVVPCRAIAPDDAAGFLQPAIRIDELGADQPGVRMTLEDRQHGVEPARRRDGVIVQRSEEHTSELQSPCNLVCRLLLEKKKTRPRRRTPSSHRIPTRRSPTWTTCAPTQSRSSTTTAASTDTSGLTLQRLSKRRTERFI